MFKNMSILLDDTEIKEMKRKYIEYGMEWLGYNYDEYSSIDDYKKKLRENLEAYERGEYKLPDDPEWRKKHEEMLAMTRELMENNSE